MSHVVTVIVFELNVYEILNFYIITCHIHVFFHLCLAGLCNKDEKYFNCGYCFLMFLVNVLNYPDCGLQKDVLIDKLPPPECKNRCSGC